MRGVMNANVGEIYLLKHHVYTSTQSLFSCDLQLECLLSQCLELLWSEFVENALELAIQLLCSNSLFVINHFLSLCKACPSDVSLVQLRLQEA